MDASKHKSINADAAVLKDEIGDYDVVILDLLPLLKSFS